MGKFDPNKLAFVDCEAVKFDFETHPMVRDHDAAVNSSWDVFQCMLPNRRSQSLFVWIKFEASALDKKKRTVAKFTACFRCLFVVENFDDIVTDNPEGGGTIDGDAIISMLSIGLSTSRGQLQILLAKSPFIKLPMPVLTIKYLMDMPPFDVRDFFPEWYVAEGLEAAKNEEE
ncbi:MAG: hypothetical protein AB8F78_09165 [Saprospiraceae bacterium]